MKKNNLLIWKNFTQNTNLSLQKNMLNQDTIQKKNSQISNILILAKLLVFLIAFNIPQISFAQSGTNQTSGQTTTSPSKSAVPQEADSKKTNQPFDLPNAIIYGDVQVNVASGTKQMPNPTAALNETLLDSVNSFEKQMSMLLPFDKMPTKLSTYSITNGFLRCELGRFTSPNLDAGYAFSIDRYSLYAKAGFDYSAGHLDKSNYTKLLFDLNSDYIAPDKFWIFGGSKTRTTFTLRNNSYLNYANPNPLNLTMMKYKANVDVDGLYKGVKFATGVSFNSLKYSTDTSKVPESALNAYLKLTNNLTDMLIGGNIDLTFSTLNGTSLNFIQANAFSEIYGDNSTVGLSAGVQLAQNSFEESQFGVHILGSWDMKIDKFFTFRTKVQSGLEKISFNDLIAQNPYMSFAEKIKYPYTLADINVGMLYHPKEYFHVLSSISFKKSNDLAIFADDSLNLFKPIFVNAQVISVNVESFYNFDINNRVSADFKIKLSSNDSTNKDLPYTEMLKFSTTYYKNWTENFESKLSLSYIGTRYANVENTQELPSYINLALRMEYKLNDKIDLYLNLDNLANSDIYIFNKYKERTIFGAFGLYWKF